MHSTSNTAKRLIRMAETALGITLNLRIRAWDGSEAGPEGAPLVHIKTRKALRRILYCPNSLGGARAWVAGEVEVHANLLEVMHLLYCPEITELLVKRSLRSYLAFVPVLPEFLFMCRPWLPPSKTTEEVKRRKGVIHSLSRDKQVISHHYDVGNDFYELLLGESMTYTCAYFSTPETPLADAQKAKLDLVCRKLSLKSGQRLLDVGCGWGSFSIHAATYYGVTSVAVTLSQEQVAYGQQWIKKLGLEGKVEMRNQDYRLVTDGPYDAIAAIGIGEHVGLVKYKAYAKHMYSLLKPGGLFLNHQISVSKDYARLQPEPFCDAYVFPDGELVTIATTVNFFEKVGFEVRDVQSLRENYALTCKLWVDNIYANYDRMVQLTSSGRVRVWLVYLALASLGMDKNFLGINQTLCVKPAEGFSGMPLTREEWLSMKTPVSARNM